MVIDFFLNSNYSSLDNCSAKKSLAAISQSLKCVEVQKLLLRSSSSKPAGYSKENEHSFLAHNLQEIIEYDKSCDKRLKRGFYACFLKVQSNIELVKVLVSSSMPNILPFSKIRDNPNISK